MRGSKYYQADVSSFEFSQLNRDVVTKPVVILFGTSCQIGMFQIMLSNHFKQVPDNVYLVDIICHGVASKKSVNLYRRELERKAGLLSEHTFRNKVKDCKGSQISKYEYESGRTIFVDNEKDYFMRFFSLDFFLDPVAIHVDLREEIDRLIFQSVILMAQVGWLKVSLIIAMPFLQLL